MMRPRYESVLALVRNKFFGTYGIHGLIPDPEEKVVTLRVDPAFGNEFRSHQHTIVAAVVPYALQIDFVERARLL